MTEAVSSPRSAAQQDSIIPKGWTPTRDAPVPVVRCTMIKADGERCKKWSLRGVTVCRKHGGQLPDIREHAAAVVEAARLNLIDMADEATDALSFLLQPGSGDAIRLKAATEVLDRAGIRGGFELDVEVNVDTNPSEILARRIAQVRERMLEPIDIIEGELVDDEFLGQETLFEM